VTNTNSDEARGVAVFDLDGTLVDTAGDIVFTANHIREVVGLEPLGSAEILAQVGRGAPYLLAQLTGIPHEDRERIGAIRREFRRHYLAHQTERSHPYPGIRRALENLGRRLDLYVLSNKPHPAVLGEIAGHDLGAHFIEVWGAGAFEEVKPHPMGVLAALERSGASPDRAVMIGDMDIDTRTAHAAGVHSCFVRWGFGALREDGPTPELIVDAVDELADAVLALVC
jgi:phosphoglycolate phosphatase